MKNIKWFWAMGLLIVWLVSIAVTFYLSSRFGAKTYQLPESYFVPSASLNNTSGALAVKICRHYTEKKIYEDNESLSSHSVRARIDTENVIFGPIGERGLFCKVDGSINVFRKEGLNSIDPFQLLIILDVENETYEQVSEEFMNEIKKSKVLKSLASNKPNAGYQVVIPKGQNK